MFKIISNTRIQTVHVYVFSLRLVCLILGFWFPYFDHDAFTHYALHVLDAPASLQL